MEGLDDPNFRMWKKDWGSYICFSKMIEGRMTVECGGSGGGGGGGGGAAFIS